MRARLWLLLICLLAPAVIFAAQHEITQLPANLAEWQDWVLAPHPEINCPMAANGGYAAENCAWYGPLSLQINPKTTNFIMPVKLYAKGFIDLPGAAKLWPNLVKVNSVPAVVIEHHHKPSLLLEAGDYQIEGQLNYLQLPYKLQLPSQAGIIHAFLNGKKLAPLTRDKDNSLLLEKPEVPKATGRNKLNFKVFRIIDDQRPMLVKTLFKLNITGQPRTITIKQPLLTDSIAMGITGELPAELTQTGDLRIQAKAGHYWLELAARYPRQIDTISYMPHDNTWPKQELWSFIKHRELRQVKIMGAARISSRQTELPEQYRKHNSYLMQPGSEFKIKTISRGLTAGNLSTDLNLQRTAWLDFSGKQFVIADQISGQWLRPGRLELAAPLDLQQVRLNGRLQALTKLSADSAPGIELRNSWLNLSSRAILANSGAKIPSSWSQTFSNATMTVNLPPAWGLISLSGAKATSGAWWLKWQSLELFVLALIALIAFKNFGLRTTALITTFALLTFHLPGAPKLLWLNLLLVLVYLGKLPERLIRYGKIYKQLSIAALVLVLGIFSINQLKVFCYPSLELAAPSTKTMSSPKLARAELAEDSFAMAAPMIEARTLKVTPAPAYKELEEYDPNSVIPTGIAKPDWQFKHYRLQLPTLWSGEEQVNLWLLSPLWFRALILLRLTLLAFLALSFMGVNWRPKLGSAAKASVASIALLLVTGLHPTPVQAAYPTPELLKELKQRLMQVPACAPKCISYGNADLNIADDQLVLNLTVNAAVDTVVPVPGAIDSWLADHIELDDAAVNLNQMQQGYLWVPVAAGQHQLTLSSKLPADTNTTIHFNLAPKQIVVVASDRQLQGLRNQRLQGDSLVILASDKIATDTATMRSYDYPSFVRFTRTLNLGPQWLVNNSVTRVAPYQGAIQVSVPLLLDEQVLDPELQTSADSVQINLNANQQSFSWQSVLSPRDTVELNQGYAKDWQGDWRVNAGAGFNIRSEGYPALAQSQRRWVPWPGESLILKIRKPMGLKAKTSTIEDVSFKQYIHKQNSEYDLSFKLEATTQNLYQLDFAGEVSNLKLWIDGRPQVVEIQDQQLNFGVDQGLHRVKLGWQKANTNHWLNQSTKLKFSEQLANIKMHLNFSEPRWLLYVSGPKLGTKIFLWPILLLVVLGAYLLNYLAITPLTCKSWLLLGVGITFFAPTIGWLVLFWLVAQGYLQNRSAGKRLSEQRILLFSLTALAGISILALLVNLAFSLRGTHPLPLIGSNANLVSILSSLNWYQDFSGTELPEVTIVSLPLKLYRVLLLLWFVWFITVSIRWLRELLLCFAAKTNDKK